MNNQDATTMLAIDVATMKVKQAHFEQALARLDTKVAHGNKTLEELLIETRATRKAILGIGWVLGICVTGVGLYQMLTH
jgi:hypothetical protein